MVKLLMVGAGEIDITPPAGLPMDGYLARTGLSTGVHDPLIAQVLVLTFGDKKAALITLDVLAVSAGFADSLRQTIADTIGTTPESVMICASHTHAGPAGLQDWFPVGHRPALDSDLMQMVTDRLITATKKALYQLTEVHLSYSTGEVSGIGGDRNERGRAVDSTVTTLRFDALDREPVAILFHYACHPTILSAANVQYSADFPGAARLTIQNRYPGAICMYLNGAAGNISTRYFRRDQSFEEVTRLGNLLGMCIVDLLEHSVDMHSDLDWQHQAIELPFRQFPSATDLRLTGDARINQTRQEGIALQEQLKRALAGRTSQRVNLQALKIGPWVLLGVPGEPFTEMAQAIRTAYPFALIVGYANDYAGYFPTQAAISAETYEALSSPYDSQAHNLVLNTLSNLFASLSKSG